MKTIKLVLAALLCLPVVGTAALPQVGLVPTPILQNVGVATTVTFVPDEICFHYKYTFTNPASNTGSIESILVDLSAPNRYFQPPIGNIALSVPRPNPSAFYNPNFSLPLNVNHIGRFIAFGIAVPNGWFGSATADGFGGFAAKSTTVEIGPGQSVGGFEIQSPHPPTLKDMEIDPDWVLDVNGEATPQQEVLAGQIEGLIQYHTTVVAPSNVFPGSEDHWNGFRDDVTKLVQMGWITDATFGNTVTTKLAAARSVLDSQGSAYTQTALNDLQSAITSSTSAQRSELAYEFLLLNVNSLIANAQPPQSVPPAQQYLPKPSIITADQQVLSLDNTFTVTAQVVDQANANAPIPNYPVEIDVQGYNNHQFDGTTDSTGKFTATYKGMVAGTDQIYMRTTSREISDDGISVTWKGGPDLLIKYFIPPVLRWNGSGTLHITEATINIGDAPASASVTRYYFSSTSPVDPTTATVVGQRNVPTLAPGALSDNGGIDLPLPGSPPAGIYYMLACADADNAVGETNETNNCQTIDLAVAADSASQPIVCSAATPSQTLLWPPNHKMVNITISGVTDPNHVTPTLTITGIQQDEPVNSLGDGNTAPDGSGVGTSTAQIRSESSGIAQGGRLYFIAFTASDSVGQQCTGTVTVGVPHDQGQHKLPTDNGQRYDSTALH